MTVHILIPARNEQDCIGRCLESLLAQEGIDFQIAVIDDCSTDATRAVAESLGVRVISAGEPPVGVLGKCHALMVGTRGAQAEWLLFTDADTYHYPGSLSASVREAEDRGVDLLSYSPEQETGSWAERALMPVVFADLMQTYPPERVNDPADPIAAVNGQYVLVRREVYESLGGHAAVAGQVLEDVELALLFKRAGHRLRFRYGGGLVRTRMYRSFGALCEGWTKNLALLFTHPLRLAARRGLEFAAIVGSVPAAVLAGVPGLAAGSVLYALFLRRIIRASFPWRSNLLALFGLPVFVGLLVRSSIHLNSRKSVTWKGRTYSTGGGESKPQ